MKGVPALTIGSMGDNVAAGAEVVVLVLEMQLEDAADSEEDRGDDIGG